ncbi:MAG: glycosyltransferase family 39 protein, partial [Thermoflexales bacterium]|nr:glycosyltransferase family 39 protein [Thermoflexales bacterium]
MPALFVVWLALAFRLNGLEHVRQNYDRASPHGLGIHIRDALAEGRWQDLPRTSIVASINLPNPAGASYFYALLTAIDAHPYTATALNVLLGAVVAAVAWRVARQLFGELAGLVAGALAATSLWSSWVARGAWLQGTIEFMAALAFWLVFRSLQAQKPKLLFAALAWAAACMHTYLVAFGLLAQVIAVAVAHGLASPSFRRAALAGLGVSALSLAIYLGAALSSGAPVFARLGEQLRAEAQTALNIEPMLHWLRIASGRDYENTFVEADTPLYLERDWISDQRANVVEAAMYVGLGVAGWSALRRRSLRSAVLGLLLWSF